jgi:hypothetical protein
MASSPSIGMKLIGYVGKPKSYVMRDDEIHHKSMSGILQWCIPTEFSSSETLEFFDE